MTPIRLQNALKTKMEKILSGKRLMSQEGIEKSIQVFEQHLPRKAKSQSRNPESTFYPCVIVYLDEGNNERVKVLFVVATHDDTGDNQGYKDVMNIVEAVSQELTRNPLVNEKFEMTKCDWFYNEQDNYPYFFAWVETYWEKPRALRDDVEAMI